MLGTFHSICAHALRREAGQFADQSNFVIFDTDDQGGSSERDPRMNINEKLYRLPVCWGAISRAKNELIGADDYPAHKHIAIRIVLKRVYVEYQKRLGWRWDVWRRHRALVEDNPSVRDKYAQRFAILLVDEFQDTNLAQYALVKQLAAFQKYLLRWRIPTNRFMPGAARTGAVLQRFDPGFP